MIFSNEVLCIQYASFWKWFIVVCSSFKSGNFVIIQALTAFTFWPETYNLSVRFTVARYYATHFMSGNPEYSFIFTLLSCFYLNLRRLPKWQKKLWINHFKTSYTFLGAPDIRPQMILFTFNLSTAILV